MASPAPADRGYSEAEERTWQRVLAAARVCFARHGVRKTSMADIADEAGLVRQSLYRYATSKSDLVDAALVARLSEMDYLLRDILAATDDFEEAAVEGSTAVITAARDDAELTALLEATEGKHASEVIASKGGGMHHLVKELWHPLFDRARAKNRLRLDLDEDQMVEWIRGVYLMLVMRTDLDADSTRSAVRTYLLPSLTVCPCGCAS